MSQNQLFHVVVLGDAAHLLRGSDHVSGQPPECSIGDLVFSQVAALNQNACLSSKRIEAVTGHRITTDRDDFFLCLKAIPQTGPFLL
jgi:hypothetical protein